MSNYLADKSFLAVKPQSVTTTPVIPNHFIPLLSESIRVNPNFAANRAMKGLSWKSDELLKGPRQIEGQLEIWADPDSLAHLINMCFVKTSTSGSAPDGYTHIFDIGEGKSYSLDIVRGIYAQRIYGVRGDKLKFSFEDNKMKATIDIKALGQFYTASVAIALTGAGMTTAVLSTDYDLRPSDGLVIGDVVNIGGVDLTLTSVNVDGKTIGFASTAVTAAVGDPVFLKAQTPSFTALQEPFYFGNTLVGIAATSALADTAAAAKSTATPCYDLGLEIQNDLFAAPASGFTGPASLLNQVRGGALDLTRLFADATQYQKWIENVKQAVTIITTGRFIKSDLTTSEKLTIKMNKTKLISNEEPLNVGQYIFDKQKFELLYDNTDGDALTLTIVNRTAGTDY
jgi:hypothetical protein